MSLNRDVLLLAACILVAILASALFFLGTAQNETIESYQSALNDCIARSNLAQEQYITNMSNAIPPDMGIWRNTK